MKTRFTRCRPGLSLVESIFVLTILSIIAVAVGVGLQSICRAPAQNDKILAVADELQSELDAWRACAFGNSPWPATLPYTASDMVTITIAGQPKTFTRSISMQKWDPSNITTGASPQNDFVRILITIDGQTAFIFLTNPA